MYLRMINDTGIGLLLIAVALLVGGLAWRASSIGSFLLAALWTLSPYVILFIVLRYWGRTTVQALVGLVASLFVVAFGVWLVTEVLFLNFNPIGAGIAMSM